MPNPIPIRNLLDALGQQAETLITVEWPADFYAANGFQPAPDIDTAVRHWLEYAGQIYFKDTALSEIIENIRAKYFTDLMVSFIAVVDEDTKTIRTQAWKMFVKKLLGESSKSDLEKCAEILTKLANDNYEAAFTLDQYHIAKINVANSKVNAALVVMNISIKEAFNFLTTRNMASAIPEMQAIIYKHLLHSIVSEQHKNALIQSLLTYVYSGGILHKLYSAHNQNLNPSDFHLNAKADWAQTTIQFLCSENKVTCIEQTPIDVLIATNPSLSKFPLEHSANLIESVNSVTFDVAPAGKVDISVNYAKSHSYDEQAINMIKEKWQNKLVELATYARHFAVQQQHDAALQNILFGKYPELCGELINSNAQGCFTFFYYQPTPEEKGRQIFKYVGRNAPEFNAVYLVYELFPEMKFYNATVLTQSPGRLLQFDQHGKLLELEKGTALKSKIPLCAMAYLSKPRYAGIIEFIKPKLTAAEYEELNQVIANKMGIALTQDNDYFVYVADPAADDKNIINFDKKHEAMSMGL